MVRLLVVLGIALCFSASLTFGDEVSDLSLRLQQDMRASTQDADRASVMVFKIRNEIEREGFDAIARRTDEALDELVTRGNRKLEEAGETEYAYFKQSEWNRDYKGFLTRMSQSRHIGDHPTEMLSIWLEAFYDKLEITLGVSICKALHLSDIKTINCATKIVFKPCSFAMDSVTIPRKDEYRNHFAKDEGADELYGEVPVITFWAVTIGMAAGGVTVPFVGMLAEYAMGKWLAPPLSNWIWDKACNW